VSKLPIVEGLMKYIKEKNIPFSMPGHKGGRGFYSTEEGKRLFKSIIDIDITEVDGLDNLHSAEGIIAEAQCALKKLYGSEKSYFLVNGSTSGNLAMIFSTFNEGDKIIVERNCHRSIFNAIIMRKLKPIYIKNLISESYNAPFSIDMEHFLQLIEEHSNIRGIVITYPNYYGICTDIKKVIREAHKRDIRVLVDSAHGAHFGINSFLPESAVALGADMVVMSAHKTLPSMTQTAYLHIGKAAEVDKVDFYVSAFTSTSPSYPLLASLDYARFYMEQKGSKDYAECINLANKYRTKINALDNVHIISKEELLDNASVFDKDESRYIINVLKRGSGHHLLSYLRGKGIQAEMSDENNVILILSPFNTEDDFDALYKALKNYTSEAKPCKHTKHISYKLPQVVLQPYEAIERKKFRVLLKDAEGRVAGENIVPYPPGVPLLIAGEYIDREAVEMIKYCLDNELTVLGIENEMIKVI
jgi:arginine/lysine/ornithine decarboxylase